MIIICSDISVSITTKAIILQYINALTQHVIHLKLQCVTCQTYCNIEESKEPEENNQKV